MTFVFEFQTIMNKIRESYNALSSSHDLLLESDTEDKYLLAMCFINNADMNKLAAENYYESHKDLERSDFEFYFQAFEKLKFEMLEVIKDKDTNTSYVSSRKDNFDNTKVNLENFLINVNRDNKEASQKQRDHKYNTGNISGLVKPAKPY